MSEQKGGLYLTIDDGPSERFIDLVDFLKQRSIPAVFFNRGDMMEAHPDAVIYGIKNGYIMANHAYSHRRFSTLSFKEACEEITRTEKILDNLYEKAGVKRLKKYMRFPHMDRGMGAWITDFDTLPRQYHETVKQVYMEGLNVSTDESPSKELKQKAAALQTFLNKQGFTVPFKNINFPWFKDTKIGDAAECLFTYSTADWMLTARHLVKNWPHKTLDDLKTRIDRDPRLNDPSSNNIILVHDQAELHDVVTALIDYFLQKNFKYLDFEP